MEINFQNNFQFYMLTGIFVLGVLTFLAGVVVLLSSVWGFDQKKLITQTNKLAQKGLSEELSGLVGNASLLITSINDMVRTRNGIGFLLVLTGSALMIAAYWLSSTYGIY